MSGTKYERLVKVPEGNRNRSLTPCRKRAKVGVVCLCERKKKERKKESKEGRKRRTIDRVGIHRGIEEGTSGLKDCIAWQMHLKIHA
mmetsp:Transcript_52007/g.101850  ORF Transcript_52007/g.101850 Transcript_52007/m.101850 type:complete len:87 (+) Transcript_52007:412-672(+)